MEIFFVLYRIKGRNRETREFIRWIENYLLSPHSHPHECVHSLQTNYTVSISWALQNPLANRMQCCNQMLIDKSCCKLDYRIITIECCCVYVSVNTSSSFISHSISLVETKSMLTTRRRLLLNGGFEIQENLSLECCGKFNFTTDGIQKSEWIFFNFLSLTVFWNSKIQI